MLLNKSDMALVPDEAMHEYGALDAVATYRVGKILKKKLQDDGMWDYYRQYGVETAKNLLRSSLVGIKIDVNKLAEIDNYITDIIDHHKRYLVRQSKIENFNPDSSQQLATVIFEKLNLPVVKKTATGKPSTDEETLTELLHLTDNSFLKMLMEYRKITKLKGTYLTPTYTLIDDDHFIHPKWKFNGTKTGRVTSEMPATTTVPRDKEYKIHGVPTVISLRAMYSVPKGYEMAYWDLKQGELRCLAVLADDEAFKAVLETEDPHAQVAIDCDFAEKDGTVTKETRTLFKVFNFGMIYGATEQRVSHDTGVPLEIVQDIFRKHKKKYPRSHLFLDNIAQVALKDGYLESPFGTRKHVVQIAKSDEFALSKLIREFRNFLPQNTCALIMTKKFNKICKVFRKYPEFGVRAWPVNLVYDASQAVYKEKYHRQVNEIILENMLEPCAEMDNYVFPISLGFGKNWSEAEHHTEDFYKV